MDEVQIEEELMQVSRSQWINCLYANKRMVVVSHSTSKMVSARRLPLLTALFLLLAGNSVGCYTSIFSFGDSIADTGNAKCRGMGPTPPYGETYFGYCTGRFSNGRLIVDFIAQALGLPLLRPYLEGGSAEDFQYGVNFAFGGATALNTSFFKAKGFGTLPECCLGTQIEWFKKHLTLLCSGSDCKDILSNSLILMGEIGGNDYNIALFDKMSINEIQAYVPIVISSISEAIKVLVEFGATTFFVPGNFPIGCVPAYLTEYQTTTADAYDTETGCLKWLNELSQYHNSKLLDEIDHLRKLYPQATIIYADYYEATLNIYRSARQLGFESPLSACCGIDDGPYNFNWSTICGVETSNVCSNPSTYLSWDGFHFTEAAYGMIAHSLLDGTYTYPSFTETCAQFQQSAAL